MNLQLLIHPEDYALTRSPLDLGQSLNAAGPLSAIVRLGDELTIVTRADCAPAGGETVAGFRLIEVRGSFALESTGVVASVATPLARAGVSLFAFSVWSTDAFLVRAGDLERARRALTEAGHGVSEA